MPNRFIKHSQGVSVGCFQRWLEYRPANQEIKTHARCEEHHSNRFAAQMERKGTKKEEVRLVWKAHSAWVDVPLLLPLSVDIRLQFLQPFNKNSHQQPFRQIPVFIQTCTSAASLIFFVLWIPASWTKQLLDPLVSNVDFPVSNAVSLTNESPCIILYTFPLLILFP